MASLRQLLLLLLVLTSAIIFTVISNAEVPKSDNLSPEQKELWLYAEALDKKVKKHWFPPMMKRSAEVITYLEIGPKGELIKLLIKKSSGFPVMDLAATEAVKAAMPFELGLPKGYPHKTAKVELTFDYQYGSQKQLLQSIKCVQTSPEELQKAMDTLLPGLNSPPRQIDYFHEMARNCQEEGKFIPAEKLYRQALKLSKEANLMEYTAYEQIFLGRLLYDSQRYDEAGQLYEAASLIYQQADIVNEKHIAQLNENYGLYYDFKHLYNESESSLNKALAYYRKTGLPEAQNTDISRVYCCLGLLFVHTGEFEKAQPYYQKALSILEKVHGENNVQLSYLYFNMGQLNFKQENYFEAEKLHQKAWTLQEKGSPQNIEYMATIINGLGNVYMGWKKYDLAEPCYIKALSLFKEAVGEDNAETQAVQNNLETLHHKQALKTGA